MKALGFMTLDILENILKYAENPGRLGQYLTGELRELLGGRIVALLQCMPGSHRLVNISPLRHKIFLDSPDFENLLLFCHEAGCIKLWDLKKSPDYISELLIKMGLTNSLSVPLKLGNKRVGLLIFLELMDTHRIEEVIKALHTLSSVVALIFRNSLIYEAMEAIISERTRELSKSERLFRSLTEVSPAGIFRTDINANILYVNRRWTHIAGLSSKEIVGKCLYEFIYPADLPPFQDKWNNVIEENLHMELRLKFPNGSPVWVFIQLASELDDRNEICGVIGTITDITERKKAEEDRKKLEDRLRQAQKLESIGTLAGGVAHDFNNILGAIIGYTELCIDDAEEGTLLNSNLYQLLQSGLRAKDLVKQILTFSRYREEAREPVIIASALKEPIKLLRATLPSTIKINHHIMCPENTLILADYTQIHQIIMNLATNSAYAMRDRGGTLTVSLRNIELDEEKSLLYEGLRAGSYVKLMVSDTGDGMDSVTRERIFEPYFTTKKFGEGTGLGLSVVHGIVKSCEGDIVVHSEPGKGTVFHILFPRINTSSLRNEKKEVKIWPGAETILLVDDEEDIVYVTGERLERLGYKVVGTSDGLEAFQIFQKEPDRFDLVVTDQTMPEITGDKLARKILTLRPDIPVILCSGYTETMNLERAKAAGIREFIVKPLSIDKLSETIRFVIDRQVL